MIVYDGEADIDHFLEIASARALRVVVETKTLAGLKESIARLKRHSE
jgi:hypothetical protein